jgi:hypothetical protein
MPSCRCSNVIHKLLTRCQPVHARLPLQALKMEHLLILIWEGAFAAPFNFPGTRFRKAVLARKKLVPLIQVLSVTAHKLTQHCSLM